MCIFKWSIVLLFTAICQLNTVRCAEVYQQLSAAQLESELQNSTVKFQAELEIIAIVISNVTVVQNSSLLDSFPPDPFTDNERLDGAVIFHISTAIYFFVLLAVVCHDYFLPSVECICDDLNISKDVAAASFAAFATIAPEFFTNIISSFVADSEVGLGGIFGSLMFNVLGVGAFAGLATANKFVQLDWWPLTRDCCLYTFSILVLISFTWDGQISLRESAVMVSLVSIYMLVLVFNQRIMYCIKWIVEINLNWCHLNSYDFPVSFIETNLAGAMKMRSNDLRKITESIEAKPKSLHGCISKSSLNDMPIFMIYMERHEQQQPPPSPPSPPPQQNQSEKPAENGNKCVKSLWSIPMTNRFTTMWFIYTWPIKLLLTLTIPNPKTYRRFYPFTFIMCIVWIGVNSYVIVWMLSVIGYTFGIPEAVMGLTFLAAGNCMPEAMCVILMIRSGEKSVGVSNSLGSSSLNIFLSLGLPWFIRNLVLWTTTNAANPCIRIDTLGIRPTVLLLFLSVLLLYGILTLSRYRLSRNVGLSLLASYSVLVVLSVLFEMDLFSAIASVYIFYPYG